MWSKDGSVVSSYEGQVWLFQVAVSDEGEYSCARGQQMLSYLLQVQGTCRSSYRALLVVVMTTFTT